MPVSRAKWLRDPDGGEPQMLEAVFDGETLFVPADVNNRHFAEIKNAEFRGEITIEPPDPEPVAEPDPYRNLSPAQFDWMLAYYNLEDIWAGLTADSKASNNKSMYANLRAQEKRAEYQLSDTLTMMQQVRDQPKIANSGVDLSDDAIRRYWRHAAVQDFASMTAVVPEPPIPATGETGVTNA